MSPHEKHIPLTIWASERFDPPPSIRTLRRWVRDGRIHPEPILAGREYRVRRDAEYVPPGRSVRLDKVSVLKSEDPIVNAILSGQTP